MEALIPSDINNDDKRLWTRANKVTELSFDFNLRIIYLQVYQNFVFPSSKQEFFLT